MSHRVTPGSTGHCWFLQVGIKYLDDVDPKTTMLLGLSSLMEILPEAIEDFSMHPLAKGSSLPPLKNNKEAEGFPTSALVAFQYFLVKNKGSRPDQHQASVPSAPPTYKFNDEEDFKAPTAMWGGD